MTNIHFKIIPFGTVQYYQAIKLREEVLRQPIGSQFTEEELEKERTHIHIAGFVNNKMASSVVLTPEGDICKMQHVAVLPNMQELSIGSQMMEFCKTVAKEHGFQSIYCHARDSAITFYQKNGYISTGDYFNELDTPHIKMKKVL